MTYSANTTFYQYSDFEDTGLYIGESGKMLLSPGKRLKNVYDLLYTPENLIESAHKAVAGKEDKSEVQAFKEDFLENLDNLWEMFGNETFEPGPYTECTIYEPKERKLLIAPFFPDRIVHQCIINVLSEHWLHIYTENTYACIKGRGIHKCKNDVGKALKNDKKGTRYCLKTDISKFYDNVDHGCLKGIIRYTIADNRLLRLLDKIIDSNGKSKGLPIGNYTSQYFANLYLAYFDHYVMEILAPLVWKLFHVKLYYFRYMDDMVFLCESKEALFYILDMAGLYLATELKLEFKHNWQVFPTDDRSIDFVGYVQNHYNCLLRKTILTKMYRKSLIIGKATPIKDENDIKHNFSSEYGWIIGCSEIHRDRIFNTLIENGSKCFNGGVALN